MDRRLPLALSNIFVFGVLGIQYVSGYLDHFPRVLIFAFIVIYGLVIYSLSPLLTILRNQESSGSSGFDEPPLPRVMGLMPSVALLLLSVVSMFYLKLIDKNFGARVLMFAVVMPGAAIAITLLLKEKANGSRWKFPDLLPLLWMSQIVCLGISIGWMFINAYRPLTSFVIPLELRLIVLGWIVLALCLWLSPEKPRKIADYLKTRLLCMRAERAGRAVLVLGFVCLAVVFFATELFKNKQYSYPSAHGFIAQTFPGVKAYFLERPYAKSLSISPGFSDEAVGGMPIVTPNSIQYYLIPDATFYDSVWDKEYFDFANKLIHGNKFVFDNKTVNHQFPDILYRMYREATGATQAERDFLYSFQGLNIRTLNQKILELLGVTHVITQAPLSSHKMTLTSPADILQLELVHQEEMLEFRNGSQRERIFVYETKNTMFPAQIVPLQNLEAVSNHRDCIDQIVTPEFLSENNYLVSDTSVNPRQAKIETFDDVQDRIDLKKMTPTSLKFTVELREEALIYLPRTFNEKWEALLDGMPIDLIRVNCAFTGVVSPPGMHVVELKFSPASSWQYLVSIFSLALALAITFRRMQVWVARKT